MTRKKLRKGSAAAKAWGRRMKLLRGRKSSPVRRKRRLSRATTPIRRKRRRANTMVRRRSYRRRRSGLGGGKLMRGLYKPTGLIAAALLGIAAAEVSKNAPQVVPYQDKAAAFIVSGVPGVGGVIAKEMISGRGLSAGGGMFNY